MSSRWGLGAKAAWWRSLQRTGTYISTFPPPPPPAVAFTRTILIKTEGDKDAAINLLFYVPKGYDGGRKMGKKLPVVVNFHGGGFTLGAGADDARWAQAVIDEIGAVLVSVEYRLAPQWPFPTAVEDGVEALMHLAAKSGEYGIDPDKFALSGFSSGGNLTFTVSLKMHDMAQKPNTSSQLMPKVVVIASFYPILDFRISREVRRAKSRRPEKTLPPSLTDLFDEAYLPGGKEKESPFASPAAASDGMLVEALPNVITMCLCEWDMLLDEGEVFSKRLRALNKDVDCTVIEGVPHAFDKLPTFFTVDPRVQHYYKEACGVLKRALVDEPSLDGLAEAESSNAK